MKVKTKATTKQSKTQKSKRSGKTASRTARLIKADSEDVTDFGLKRLAVSVFGEDAIRNLQQNGFKVREIWELCKSPTIQCNKSIGGVKYGKTSCWICGLTIEKKVVGTSDRGLSPECEHVLPIAQAILYLSLYSGSKKKGDAQDEEDFQEVREKTAFSLERERKSLELEYGWAHNVCNQEKSDLCPITKSKETGNLEINEREIKKMLDDIYTSRRSKEFEKRLVSTYKTREAFVGDRQPVLMKRYQDIIDFFSGGERRQYQELFLMAGFAVLEHADFVQKEYHDILLNKTAIEKATKSFEKTRGQEVRRMLGFSSTDDINRKTAIVIRLQKLLQKSIKNNIQGMAGPGTEVYKTLSKMRSKEGFKPFNYFGALDFLQYMFLKFITKEGVRSDTTYQKKVIEDSAIFLTIKYFESFASELEGGGRQLEKIKEIIQNLKQKISYDKIQKIYETEFQIAKEPSEEREEDADQHIAEILTEISKGSAPLSAIIENDEMSENSREFSAAANAALKLTGIKFGPQT